MKKEHPLVIEARLKMEKSILDCDKAFANLIKTIIKATTILTIFGLWLFLLVVGFL